MKKSQIIALGLLALAILGVCIYFFVLKSPAQNAQVTGQSTEKSQGITETAGTTPALGGTQDSGNTTATGPKRLKP